MTEGRGETSDADHEGTESPLAKRDTQSPATGELHRQPLNPIEPPWYGPVCPVVWEGRSREAPPYPDQYGLCRFVLNCMVCFEGSGPPSDPRVTNSGSKKVKFTGEVNTYSPIGVKVE